MKFYNKKLKSLEDLKREKNVLQYAKKHTAQDSPLDFRFLTARGNATATVAGVAGKPYVSWLPAIVSAATSGSIMKAVIALAPPLLKMMGRKTGVSGKVGRSIKGSLKGVLIEVALGYVKWKALQMAYRGVMLFVKSKKSKR